MFPFIAAVDPNAVRSMNNYIGPEFVMIGKPAVTATERPSWDEKSQRKLWEESVRITGVDFLPVSK